MRAGRFTDAQKAFILKQADEGMPVTEVCRKAGTKLCHGQAPLAKRIRELCETRVRYGYRRVHVLLRRDG